MPPRKIMECKPSTSRKRKVNEELRKRAEALLAKTMTNDEPKPSSTFRSKKRKLQETEPEIPTARKSTQNTKSTSAKQATSVTKSPRKASKASPPHDDEEKRLRRFRPKAPQSYLQKLYRSQTQRMVVLQRTRGGTEECPSEDIELVGTTGNIYTVTIRKVPSCTCPDHQKGNECKHKVYALTTVLKAPNHLQYQTALLSSELREIFASAPAIPTDVSSDGDGKRKPIEGECPICYMDFDEEKNELVWCKAACGNNMHKSCFDQWAASQRGVVLKCVYCRTPWQADTKDPAQVIQAGSVGIDGYVNVGEQFGLSEARDYSTYHPYWANRRYGAGW